MSGSFPTLYVVATPIGNLGDWSPRAVETLKGVDFIAAEDTRVTMKLCQVFDIHTRLISCHRHNEGAKSESLAEWIAKDGLTAALMTDAGTPCISDPGNELVHACIERGIRIIPIPGCCAAAAAISVSGFDAREFTFYGFLPREKKALREKLQTIGREAQVAVLHESPYRIIDLMEQIAEVLPQARLAVCCDLTKLYEKTLYGLPDELLTTMKGNEKTEKGEYCVVMDVHDVPAGEQTDAHPDLPVESLLVARMTEKNCSLQEAQETLIAEGFRKNAVKQAVLSLKIMFPASPEQDEF